VPAASQRSAGGIGYRRRRQLTQTFNGRRRLWRRHHGGTCVMKISAGWQYHVSRRKPSGWPAAASNGIVCGGSSGGALNISGAQLMKIGIGSSFSVWR